MSIELRSHLAEAGATIAGLAMLGSAACGGAEGADPTAVATENPTNTATVLTIDTPTPTATPFVVETPTQRPLTSEEKTMKFAQSMLLEQHRPEEFTSFTKSASADGQTITSKAEAVINGHKSVITYVEGKDGSPISRSIVVEEFETDGITMANSTPGAALEAEFAKFFAPVSQEIAEATWKPSILFNNVTYNERIVPLQDGRLSSQSSYVYQPTKETIKLGLARCEIYPSSPSFDKGTCFDIPTSQNAGK